MTVVRVRLTPETAELLAALRGVDAQLLTTQAHLEKVQSGLDFTKGAASAAGFAIGLRMLYDEMGNVVQRYNTLHSLDQAGLFFNTRLAVDSLTKGMGDLAVNAMAAQTAVRFAASGADLNPTDFQQIGAFGRGLVLGGLAPDIGNAMDAIFMDIVGGRSQRLHTLGVPVNNTLALRDYAAGLGVRPQDLTGQQQIQARLVQLQETQAFINKANFGSTAAEATGFQQAGAFIQNTKDSYVRSLAGAWEELAKGIYHAATASSQLDPQKLAAYTGQAAAIATPIVTGLGAIGLNTFAASGRINQIEQLRAQLPSAIRSQEMALYDARNAAQVAQLRRIEAETQFNQAPIFGPSGQPVRFDQWSRGAAVMGRETQAARNVVMEEERMANLRNQATRADSSIASASRSMIAFNVATAALSVGISLWTAYTNAVQGAKRAVDEIKGAGAQGIAIGQQVKGLAAAGADPSAILEAAKQGGLGGAYAGKLDAFIQAGHTPDEVRNQAALLYQQQVAEQRVPEIARGLAWSWDNQVQWGLMMNPPLDPAQTPYAQTIAKAQAEREVLRFQSQMNKRFAADDALKQGGVQVQTSEDFAKLQAQLATQKDVADMQRRIAREQGVPEDVIGTMIDDANRAESRTIIGFAGKAGDLKGDEAKQYQRMLTGAVRSDITLDEQDRIRKEQKAIDDHIASLRKNVENMDKENAARGQIAKMQDDLLGSNRRLLDTTNEESATRQSAQNVVQQYQALLVEGNQTLIDEFTAHHNVRAALELENAARLDLTKELRDAIGGIQAGVPALLDSAASTIGSVLSGQTNLSAALAGDNKFLASGAQLLGKVRETGLNAAQLGIEQQLADALAGGAYTRGSNPLIDQALSAYGNMNRSEQGAYRNSLQSDIYKRQDDMRSGVLNALAGYVDLQNSLQNVPYEQGDSARAFLKSQTAAELSRLVPFLAQSGISMKELPPDLLAGIQQIIPKGFDITKMTGAGLEGQFAGQLTGIAVERSELSQSMYDLKGAVEELTAAFKGYTQPYDPRSWGDAPAFVGPTLSGALPKAQDTSAVYGPDHLGVPSGGSMFNGTVNYMADDGYAQHMQSAQYRASVLARAQASAPKNQTCAACASIPLVDAGVLPHQINHTGALADALKAEGWTVVPPSEARKAPYSLMFTESHNRDPAPDHVYTMIGGQAWDKGKLYGAGKGRGGTTPDAYGMIPPADRAAFVGPVPVTVTNIGALASMAAGKAGPGISGAASRALGGSVLSSVSSPPMPYFAGQPVDMSTIEMAGWGGDTVPIAQTAATGDFGAYTYGETGGTSAGVTSDWAEYN